MTFLIQLILFLSDLLIWCLDYIIALYCCKHLVENILLINLFLMLVAEDHQCEHLGFYLFMKVSQMWNITLLFFLCLSKNMNGLFQNLVSWFVRLFECFSVFWCLVKCELKKCFDWIYVFSCLFLGGRFQFLDLEKLLLIRLSKANNCGLVKILQI